jgi:hypothetical protein
VLCTYSFGRPGVLDPLWTDSLPAIPDIRTWWI